MIRSRLSSRPRAFGLIELVAVLAVLAITAAVSVSMLTGNSSSTTTLPGEPAGVGSVSNMPSYAQNTADSTTAISIAQAVAAQDQSTNPPSTPNVAQYQTAATSGTYPQITGVTADPAGAKFNFSAGSPVCVSVSVTPALVTC